MSSHRRPAVPLVVIFAACLAAVPTASAAPEVAWTSTFGGPGADQGWAAAPTTGGGFVLAGTTDPMSTGVEDVYLIRIDDQGRKVWERTYGGDARDAARAVLQLPDGGFVLAGDTGVPPTAYDLLVIRTDADGESLWQTRIGGTGRNEGRGVCATTDGGFVVCGDAYSATAGIQFHVVKLDADGGVVWDRTYGGSDDHAYAVVETTDRGLVVCGYSGDGRTFPEFAARVFKLSAGGGMLWQRTFSLSVDDRAHDLRPLPDGGVVVAGISGGLTRLWRLDWTGFPSWSRDYPANTGDAYAVEISPHGGFYVAGYAYAYQYGAYQISLLETDAQGALLSSQRLGGAGWEFARGLAVQPGGNLVVAGSTNSEGAGGYDVFAIGLDVGAVSAVDDLPDLKTDTITASPNPFNPRVNVSFVTTQDGHARLRVFDLRGRQVAILHEGTLAAGTHTAAWDGVDLTGRAMPTGTYLLQLVTPAGETMRKVSLVR